MFGALIAEKDTALKKAGSLDRLDNAPHRNLGCRPGQAEASRAAPIGAQQAMESKPAKDLGQEGTGEMSESGEPTDVNDCALRQLGQLGEPPKRILGLLGEVHS
jgi:hypothetical protein